MSMMSIIPVQVVMLFYMQLTYCYWRRQYQNLKNYYMRVKTNYPGWTCLLTLKNPAVCVLENDVMLPVLT